MIIDTGVFLGHDPTIELGLPQADLMARLRSFGARHALATSFRGIYYDYREGNAETLASSRDSNGFIQPLATVNPLSYDQNEAYFLQLKQDGFRVVGLFPQWQGWSWQSASAAAVMRGIAGVGLTALLSVVQPQDLAQAAELTGRSNCRAIIRWLGRGMYSAVADILALARQYPDLLFDVGGLSQAGIIEYLSARIGADRLVFGSSAPLAFEGSAYFSLYAARLTPEDRQAIEYGNMAALLGLDAASGLTVQHPDWSWLRDHPKIDTHWHTGSWHLIEPRIDFDNLLADLDVFHIRGMSTSSILALNYDIKAGNAETLALIERDPRVFGLLVVNPYQPEESLHEIETYAGHPRFVGLKTIQDYYQDRGPLRLDHPSYKPIFDRGARLGWPLMAHLPGMFEAARLHPGINFIAAHSTWNYKALAALPNVFFDIATSSPFRRDADLAGLVEAAGSDRVIFSSDSQLMGPAWTLGKLVSSGLDRAVLGRILNENALRAFPRMAKALTPGRVS
jgi:predicted TIM-barrel fold metal-dependent hydrolase